jgi:hypothetical protein
MQKKKLIYILPEYNKKLDGHISYLANFIESVARDVDVFLIIEKCRESSIDIDNVS